MIHQRQAPDSPLYVPRNTSTQQASTTFTTLLSSSKDSTDAQTCLIQGHYWWRIAPEKDNLNHDTRLLTWCDRHIGGVFASRFTLNTDLIELALRTVPDYCRGCDCECTTDIAAWKSGIELKLDEHL